MTAWLIMFAGMFVLDLLWAAYTHAIGVKNAMLATGTAALIYSFGGLVTIQYVSDPWLLLPATTGAMAGTWVAVKYLEE